MDDAGNCGPIADVDVAVDTTQDAINGLSASDGGIVIGSGVWYSSTTPTMNWDDSSSTSPIVGYSWSIAGDPNCTSNGATAQTTLSLGQGTTTFRVRSLDEAGNCGPIVPYALAVDTQDESIGGLQALTESAGSPIGSGVWQTDADPFMTWDASASTSPLAGYSWSLNDSPDCDPETTGTNAQLPLLPDGQTTFQVRAIDVADNCGPVQTYTLAVDQEGSPILNLSALTEPAGSPIPDGVWQQDNTPFFTWDASSSTSPVAGYNWSVSGDPTCDAAQTETTAEPSAFAEGVTTFSLLSRDVAGNCGDVATLQVAVDTEDDTLPNLRALTESGPDGTAIDDNAWQQDAAPVLLWDAATSTSPVLGYSYSASGAPDCSVDTTDTQVDLVGLTEGVTTFSVAVIDAAGNCGIVASFDIAVDTQADSVANLSGRNVEDAVDILDAIWQQDDTPTMLWEASASTAPDVGYSWSLDDAPDCASELTELTLTLATLPEGLSTFRVLPIDAAGNCGNATSFVLAVDTEDDLMMNLRAETAGGSPISDGNPQQDPNPIFRWDNSFSTSPIVGYSWSISGTPDCTTETAETTAVVSSLPEGTTTFRIRTVDSAGNCGSVASFDVVVDTEADSINNLRALTELAGDAITHSTWQTDTDPLMLWDESFPAAPGAGYSFTSDGSDPDCSVDTTAIDQALSGLAEGITEFKVRPIDAALNCGSIAIFAIAVDTQSDDMDALRAENGPGAPEGEGSPLADGQWTRDTVPLVLWDESSSTAPIVGYSWSTSGAPTATVDTSELEVALSALPDGITTFRILAVDLAGNLGAVDSIALAVDTNPDDITNLRAFTQFGGTLIPESVHQDDNSPFFDWNDTVSTAPVAGYSWSLGALPDCVVDVSESELTLSDLPQGSTILQVAAIDVAGNCGAPSTFEIAIDSEGDAIVKLQGLTELGGALIDDGVWQRDNTPVMTWDPSESTAGIDGYSWSIAGTPDDTVNTSELSTELGTLPDGVTVFRIRAIDTAGNLGEVSSYQLAVDTVADSISNLRADPGSILNGTWQSNPNPTMRWDAAVSTSPVAGYSYSTDGAADCVVDTTLTETALALENGTSTFSVRVIDQAGNCGADSSFVLAVDTEADDIGSVTALTEVAGSPIPESTWQQDNSPVMVWDEPSSDAPISGYSWGTSETTDCIVDTDSTSVELGTLADGVTNFWVRAIDWAGNCGDPARFELAVDNTGDAILDLVALTEFGGGLIPESLWQQDNDPYMTWTEPVSPSPIVFYTIGVDTSPASCDGTHTLTNYPFAEDVLADGQHTVYVRALDQAGNCGPVAEFNVWVLVAAPILTVEAIVPNPAGLDAELSIRVSADRVLADPPTVTVDGRNASYLSFVAEIYSYRYDVTGAESEGPVDVIATGEDLAGNIGSGLNQVTLDFTAPRVAEFEVIPPVATTNDVVQMVVTSDEILVEPPVVTVDTDNPTTYVSEAGNAYTFDYTVTGAEGEGPVEVGATLRDQAGNTGAGLTTFVLDLTAPEVSVTQPDRRLVLDLNDVVEVVWTTTELHPDVVSVYLSRDGGDTFPELLAEDIPDIGSYSWTVSGEETLNARFRIVARDIVGLEGTGISIYDSRIRDPQADHILATTATGTIVIGSSGRVNITAVDSQGDSIDGVFEITVTVSGSALITGTSLDGATPGSATVTGTTLDDGTATLDVFNLVAENVDVSPSADLPAEVAHIGTSIRFAAQLPDHLVLAVDDGIAAVGGTEDVTITAVDTSGNLSDTDVEVRIAVDGNAIISDSTILSAIGLGTNEVYGRLRSDGTAVVTVTSPVTESVTVSGHSDSLPNVQEDESAAILFSQVSDVDPNLVEVVAIPPRVFADGEAYSEITVTPYNFASEVMGSGLDVEVFVDQGDLDELIDLGDGTYTTRLRSRVCYDEPVIIDVRVEDVLMLDAATVTFTCDEVADAIIESDPDTIIADGDTCAVITVELFDADGNPLPAGQYVNFGVSYGDVTEATDEDGVYTATLCTGICTGENIEVSATVNGVPLQEIDSDLYIEVAVECLGVDPSTSLIEASPRSLNADGFSASTISVTPIRLDGEQVGSGLVVVIDTSLGVLTDVFDEGDGTYTAQLTSETSGEATVTATVAGVELDSHELVSFLEFTPPGDWIRLEPVLLETPRVGGAFSVSVDVLNDSGRVIEDVVLRMSAELGTEIDASLTTWNGDAVSVSFDGAAGEWQVDLGTIELPSDEIPQLLLALRSPQGFEGTNRLVFRAFQGLSAISAQAELEVALTDGNAVAVEACSCSARTNRSTSLVWLIPALAFVSLRRRRRRSDS